MAHGRELDCLECGTELSQRQEHGVTIDYCEDCGGVWLDPGELEALTGKQNHHKKRHKHEIDVDDAFEEDDEYEDEQEDDGGILGTIADALAGGEEDDWGEDEEFEEEDDWGGEAEFEEDF